MILSENYDIDELSLAADQIEEGLDFTMFVKMIRERMGKKRIGVGKPFQRDAFYLFVRKSHYNMILQRNDVQIIISFSDNKMYWTRVINRFGNSRTLRNGFWIHPITDEQANTLIHIAKDHGNYY